MAAEAPRPFRHLSPSIAPKQHLLTADLTVKLPCPGTELGIRSPQLPASALLPRLLTMNQHPLSRSTSDSPSANHARRCAHCVSSSDSHLARAPARPERVAAGNVQFLFVQVRPNTCH